MTVVIKQTGSYKSALLSYRTHPIRLRQSCINCKKTPRAVRLSLHHTPLQHKSIKKTGGECRIYSYYRAVVIIK